MTCHPAPPTATDTPAQPRSAPTRHRRRGRRRLAALAGLLGTLAVLAVAATGIAHAQDTTAPTPSAAPATTDASGDQPPITLGPSAPASPSVPTPVFRPPDPIPTQCAWWQVGCQALDSINQWFLDLADHAVSPVLDLFGHSVLVTPDVTTVPQITQLWTITRWIANSVYVLFVLAGGFVIASHETLQTRHTLREIAPRLVVGVLAVNTSLAVIGQAITAINALTTALLGQDSMDGVATNIKTTILGQLHQDALYAVLIALIVLALTVILLASYVVRVAFTVIVVVAAPLALACHASPYTEGIARLWWRILIALLAIPALQAVTLIVFVKIFFGASASDMLSVGGSVMGLIVSAVLVFILIKIPGWVLKCAGLQRRSAIASIIKIALLAKGLGMLTGGRLGTRPHTTGGRRPPASGSRRGTTPPGPGGPGGGSGASQPAPDPDTPPPAGGGPKSTRNQQGGRRQRGGQRQARQQDAALRARAAAIRAWSAPTATTPTSTARRTSSTSGRGGTTTTVPAAPPRISAPARSTAVTPPRLSTPARPTATTPASGARTPQRIGTTPPATAPTPRREATARPAPSTTAPSPAAVTPPRISTPASRISTPPATTGSPAPSGGRKIPAAKKPELPRSVSARRARPTSARLRTPGGGTPARQKPREEQGGDRDA
jgi:hypothetical protein